MALIHCKSCGNMVSPQAAACPKCGAPVPKPTSLVKLAGMALIVAIIFPVFYSCGTLMDRATDAPPPAPPQNPEQIAAKKAKEKTFQTVVAALKHIKRSAKDPESIRWSTIVANTDASLICIEYRAKNSFGGYVVETIVFDALIPKQGSKIWNAKCGGQTLDNYEKAARALDG